MQIRLSVVGLLVLLLGGCATAPVRDIQPGARPDIDTDEAGLWMQVETIEERLKSSGRVVTDPELNTYMGDIICRLAPDYCQDVRFYIVRTPYFNATMAPNGYMEIWTGLMLRSQNEAQLAYVLGHEIGHYLRRHSVQRWRDVRKKTNMAAAFQVAASAAQVGYVGGMAELAAVASILAFSRDQEREADDIGLRLMVEAGYDPNEAPRIWEALLEELEASGDPRANVFFATHPSTEERIESLRQQATAVATEQELQDTGTQRYRDAIRPFREQWLRDEVRRREYAESEVVLRRLLTNREDVGEVYFFQGEIYRMRDGEGDVDRSIDLYQQALEAGGAPPECYRSLGIVYRRTDQNAKARAAFEQYLRLVPESPDRAIIESYFAN